MPERSKADMVGPLKKLFAVDMVSSSTAIYSARVNSFQLKMKSLLLKFQRRGTLDYPRTYCGIAHGEGEEETDGFYLYVLYPQEDGVITISTMWLQITAEDRAFPIKIDPRSQPLLVLTAIVE